MDKVKPFFVQRIVIIASHKFWEGYLKKANGSKGI